MCPENTVFREELLRAIDGTSIAVVPSRYFYCEGDRGRTGPFMRVSLAGELLGYGEYDDDELLRGVQVEDTYADEGAYLQGRRHGMWRRVWFDGAELDHQLYDFGAVLWSVDQRHANHQPKTISSKIGGIYLTATVAANGDLEHTVYRRHRRGAILMVSDGE